MTVHVTEAPRQPAHEVVTRLLVTARDLETRLYRPVGFLCRSGEGYSFTYLRHEVERQGFRPLPGLARAVDGPMQATDLFPLFAERVISARRPDRPVTFAALGLEEDAAPFEVLVRSHGQRVGDTIELLPAPDAGPGETVSFTFLSHGVRHLPETNQARINELGPGDPLRLCPEPQNPVNPRARLVTDTDELRLGWVPDPLIGIIERLSRCRVSVERSNGPEVGFHFRLLARVEGVVGAGSRLFEGSEWEPLAHDGA